jgi:hypothetical protein
MRGIQVPIVFAVLAKCAYKKTLESSDDEFNPDKRTRADNPRKNAIKLLKLDLDRDVVYLLSYNVCI